MYGPCEPRFNITAVRFELNAIILYLTYEPNFFMTGEAVWNVKRCYSNTIQL